MSEEIPPNRTAYPGHIPDDVFAAERQAILATWHTGAEVDIDEAVAYHHTLPPAKNFARVIAEAHQDGRTLAWPRTGKALLQEHINDLNEIQKVGGAELSASTADSYTRTQRYDRATAATEESEKVGRSLLNGVPVVSWGVKRTRELVEGVELANQFRTGTPDARLSAEIVLAAGFRAIQGGMLGTSLPFIKHMPITQAIRNWQYTERLIGVYQSRGVDMHREYYGALMGMIMPPSIMCASLIFDALMGAQQGTKNMTLGANNNLHVMQDVAALRVLKKLAREYLDREGHTDVTMTPLMYMWMGQFPHGESEAFAVIGLGALTAVLGNAAATVVKTPDEAFGVPTNLSNATSTRVTRAMLDIVRHQRYPDSEHLQEEMAMIERETRAIVDTAFELGDGDIATGVARAYAAGTMDVPFSPATGNAGEALSIRDAGGAVRFLEFGNLPFDEEIKNYHRERVRARIDRDADDKATFTLVAKDVSLEAFRGVELEEMVA
jgi:methylaspartate mutase epsilon subunit